MMSSSFLCRLYAQWVRLWYARATVLHVPYELARLLVSAFPHPRLCRVKLQWFEMVLDVGDLLQANILLDGVWHRELSRWLAYLSSSARVVMDIGAHCGYFSMVARRFAPAEAQIHAFEPNPRLRSQYEQTVEMNAFGNMYLRPDAVSDMPGTLTLYVRNAVELGVASRFRIAHYDETLTVPAITLDDYCDEIGAEQVDLVKMDIEGGEAAALEGMRPGLGMGRYGTLIIEFHRAQLSQEEIDALLRMLREADHVLYHLRDEDAVRLTDGTLPAGQMMAVHTARLPTLTTGQNPQNLPLPDEFRTLFP